MAKSTKRQRKKDQRRQKIEQEIRVYRARRRRVLAINLGVALVVVGSIAGLAVNAQRKGKATPGSSPSPGASPSAGGVACGGAVPPQGDHSPSTKPEMAIDPTKTYRATVETSCGTVVVELAAATQPETVNSFVALARRSFFDGLTFHRVVKGFAIQGGDPKGDGTGDPGYRVTEAPPQGTRYVKGTVAMAKGGSEPAGTSGSQFFIVPGDQAQSLPPDYAVLGKVVEGLDVLAKIEAVPTGSSPGGESSKPLQATYITKITVVEG